MPFIVNKDDYDFLHSFVHIFIIIIILDNQQ